MSRRAEVTCGAFLTLFIGNLFISVAAARAQAPVAQPFVPGRVLVRFSAGLPAGRPEQLIASLGAGVRDRIPQLDVYVVELPPAASEEAYARAFNERPEVLGAELDRVVAPAEVIPNDPNYPNEWHLSKIGCPTAWAKTTGTSGVIIAVLDTGVDSAHPDLAGKLVAGWNVYDNTADTSDATGHGTEVAGTAAAASNNGQGVASVAWGAQVMPVRITDANGFATYSTMASGLTYAADHGARVANVSFSGTDSSTVASAAQYFQSKGGVVTVAAGNNATFDSTADNPYVLTVSATDQNDTIYSWSNTGNNIDLSAPGNVYTTARGGGYTIVSGTSFAAPVVAGAAALVISDNPGLTATQVANTLTGAADDLGSPGWDSAYGWGRVNVARALGLSPSGADTTPPTVSITSPAAGANVSGVVTVSVQAGDNVGVSSVSLSVDGVTVGTLSAAPYSFAWDTTGAADGSHTLLATATDAAGNSSTAQAGVTVSNAAADTTAPGVAITSPAAGASVSGTVSVKVSASDNVGVVKVELYVDGVLTSTTTASPFTTTWNTRKAAKGAHTLQTKAYDAAGNVGASAPVTVNK